MEILTSCQATFTDMASVEVGGRNLVLRSDVERTFSNTYVTYELSDYGKKVVSGRMIIFSLDACSDIDGITIDVYLRKIVDDVGSSCNDVASIKNIGTTYKRYTIAINVQESDYIMQVAVRSSVRSGDGYNVDAKVSIKNIKVEIGDVATDYTLAPEDIDDTIEQVEQSKNRVWYQTSAPSGTNHRVNDVWFDTNDNNLMYMWDGSAWVSQTFGSTAITNGSISSEKLYGDTAIMREIIAGSIQANSIAIGDFTNYCQLNESSASKWKFDVESDVGGSWFISNPIARDKQISEWYPAKSGDKFLVKYQIATSVKGNTTSGGTDSVYASSRIALFTRDGNHSNRTYNFATATKPSDDSLNVVDVSCIITLPTPSDRSVTEFAVYLQTESYGNFSGTLKVRNVQVLKMTTGELLVNGSVTANKIDVNDLFAQDITATGTISGLKLRGEDIDIQSTYYKTEEKYYISSIQTQLVENNECIVLSSASRGNDTKLQVSPYNVSISNELVVSGGITLGGSSFYIDPNDTSVSYQLSCCQIISPTDTNKWTAYKYSDGRLRCVVQYPVENVNISTSASGWYVTSSSIFKGSSNPYPVEFKSSTTPNVQFTFTTSNTAALAWVTSAGSTTNPPDCSLIRMASATGVYGHIHIVAEGYWK